MNTEQTKNIKNEMPRDQMNLVIVGHVDHGKSTLIGRLLADTGSLPKGKLEHVKQMCKRNAKPFEYAFLLDALKDEQRQGITIDAARCFFKTKKRYYLILDAPGHIEFLKNMITGASRAEAALLVIDADEGVQENSKRHGYMLSLLGIKQVVVLINKMDLVDYRQSVFTDIRGKYSRFLKNIGLKPLNFVPVSAKEGVNITKIDSCIPWYQGPSVLEHIDGFAAQASKDQQPFRLPVQDVYKFTEKGDSRRIIAGTVQTGTVNVGDEVIFLPSEKRSSIKSIEGFNLPRKNSVSAGYATGFTLAEQVFAQRGEIMCRANDVLPLTGTTFKANVFWLGKSPLVPNKRYTLKLAATQVPVYVKKIESVLDVGTLNNSQAKTQIERHDVAECIFQTLTPIAFDRSADMEETGRFVIVDRYDI